MIYGAAVLDIVPKYNVLYLIYTRTGIHVTPYIILCCVLVVRYLWLGMHNRHGLDERIPFCSNILKAFHVALLFKPVFG